MALFNTAYDRTADVEGGYSNDVNDNGGETWKGITRNMDASWEGWKIIDDYKSKSNFPDCLYQDDNLQQKVLKYYKSQYWDSLSLDDIADQKIANELYDTGVNMGVQTSAIFFQRVLNVLNTYKGKQLYPNLNVDGRVGKRTISAYNSLNNGDREIVYKMLNALQGTKYITICEHNETQEKFIRGWAKRVFES
jgi:lysozyme family protein